MRPQTNTSRSIHGGALRQLNYGSGGERTAPANRLQLKVATSTLHT